MTHWGKSLHYDHVVPQTHRHIDFNKLLKKMVFLFVFRSIFSNFAANYKGFSLFLARNRSIINPADTCYRWRP